MGMLDPRQVAEFRPLVDGRAKTQLPEFRQQADHAPKTRIHTPTPRSWAQMRQIRRFWGHVSTRERSLTAIMVVSWAFDGLGTHGASRDGIGVWPRFVRVGRESQRFCPAWCPLAAADGAVSPYASL